MIKGIYYVSRNLELKTKNLEVVANNLANINTTGFKRELPFSELVSQYSNAPVKQLTDYTQGNLIETGNQLDFAISGDAFFAIEGKTGTEYTKNGRFRISDEGFLVNEQGYKVLGKNGEIDLSEFSTEELQKLNITKKGEIRVGDRLIDQLQISQINDPSLLNRKEGLNFFSPDNTFKDADIDRYDIQQGYLEESNTNPIIEMQSMIEINKDYEAGQKMMNFLDSSLERANEIGKV